MFEGQGSIHHIFDFIIANLGLAASAGSALSLAGGCFASLPFRSDPTCPCSPVTQGPSGPLAGLRIVCGAALLAIGIVPDSNSLLGILAFEESPAWHTVGCRLATPSPVSPCGSVRPAKSPRLAWTGTCSFCRRAPPGLCPDRTAPRLGLCAVAAPRPLALPCPSCALCASSPAPLDAAQPEKVPCPALVGRQLIVDCTPESAPHHCGTWHYTLKLSAVNTAPQQHLAPSCACAFAEFERT